MKLIKILTGLMLSTLLLLGGCKPKDSDIQSAVQDKLRANPELANVNATVNECVVTLSGEVKTDNAKAESQKEAADVKGVKSVVNNISVSAPAELTPMAAPPVIAQDDALTSSVKDAVKDFPGVTASVSDGVVTLTGNASKEDQRKIMMSISSLHPKKVDNKLTVK